MFSGAILTSAGSRLQVAMWILASQVRGRPRAHNLPGYLVSSEKCDRVHSPSLPVRLTLGRGRQSCHATTLKCKIYYSLQLSSFPLSRANLFEAECLLQHKWLPITSTMTLPLAFSQNIAHDHVKPTVKGPPCWLLHRMWIEIAITERTSLRLSVYLGPCHEFVSRLSRELASL